MPQAGNRAPLITIDIADDTAVPKHRQIFDQLRNAILDGRLRPGRRLPSTRALAKEIGVSRNTVMSAYDQLLAEGYTSGTVGSGTRVSEILPEDVLAARSFQGDATNTPDERPQRLSKTAMILQHAPPRPPSVGRSQAFKTGTPEIERFPWNLWSRMIARFWRQPPRTLLSYGEVGGYMPLRAAIADYLRAVRGLKCETEQVVVTTGAQQAIDLAVRCLLDPGDTVWAEEPGYVGIRGVVTAVGATLAPVPVDAEGLNVAAGMRSAPSARMAIVTPSHQYPLGTVMSLRRRLELLEWATAQDAWILEDDYDSEYRYTGRPISALQGLDAAGRVIYIGTFSKVLFPAIRLGYLVLPPDLVQPFLRVRRNLDDQTPIAMQPVLAEFIDSGHFAAHVRRMRVLYAERQAVLTAALRETLSERITIEGEEAGMHIVARFAPDLDIRDTDVERRAAEAGLTVAALSRYYTGTERQDGLVLGYASVPARDIKRGAATLGHVIEDLAADQSLADTAT